MSMVASAEDKAKDVKADLVYRNGFVYTAGVTMTWREGKSK